jgi:hypothetical protein
VTSLSSFYASAAQAPIQYRRYAVGAAWSIYERVGWGESIASARARVMSLPQYADALVSAGLDDDLAAVDFVASGPALATNLVPNPSFEVDTSGTTANDGGAMVVTGATLTRQVAAAQDRTAVLSIAATAISQGASIPVPGTFSQGVAYTASFYARTNGGGATGRCIFGDRSGNWVIPADLALTGSFQRFTATWTPSADRTNVALAVRNQQAGALTFVIDAVMVETGSSASAYFDGASANCAWRGTADNSISDRFA